jgi:hypothetical protein
MGSERVRFAPKDGYHYRVTYLSRRMRRHVRWWVARHVIREELEAIADPTTASARAKLGGDMMLARKILRADPGDVTLETDWIANSREANTDGK